MPSRACCRIGTSPIVSSAAARCGRSGSASSTSSEIVSSIVLLRHLGVSDFGRLRHGNRTGGHRRWPGGCRSQHDRQSRALTASSADPRAPTPSGSAARRTPASAGCGDPCRGRLRPRQQATTRRWSSVRRLAGTGGGSGGRSVDTHPAAVGGPEERSRSRSARSRKQVILIVGVVCASRCGRSADAVLCRSGGRRGLAPSSAVPFLVARSDLAWPARSRVMDSSTSRSSPCLLPWPPSSPRSTCESSSCSLRC